MAGCMLADVLESLRSTSAAQVVNGGIFALAQQVMFRLWNRTHWTLGRFTVRIVAVEVDTDARPVQQDALESGSGHGSG